VLINDFAFADNLNPNYIKNRTIKKYPSYMGGAWTPAVSINCSMQDCTLDGLFMSGIDTSESHAPAVRIYDGHVNPATIFSNTMMGGTDIVDDSNSPAGGFVTHSAGGFTIAGAQTKSAASDSVGAPLSGASDFAVLVGSTGKDTDGNGSWCEQIAVRFAQL
jgi:hypothetical protein